MGKIVYVKLVEPTMVSAHHLVDYIPQGAYIDNVETSVSLDADGRFVRLDFKGTVDGKKRFNLIPLVRVACIAWEQSVLAK